MVVKKSVLLHIVIRSVLLNGWSLLLTALLTLIVVYLFIIIGYVFFREDFVGTGNEKPQRWGCAPLAFHQEALSVGSLSSCLSVRLSVRPSVCESVCLSVCLSVSLPACLSACLPACLSVCLSVCLDSLPQFQRPVPWGSPVCGWRRAVVAAVSGTRHLCGMLPPPFLREY